MSRIEELLIFAQRELGIRDSLFTTSYLVKSPESMRFGNLGQFDYTVPLMYFRGEPEMNTVFHEATHFKQWEDGMDFNNALLEWTGICQDTYRRVHNKTQNEIDWLIYYSSPWEVEAREMADTLENKWRYEWENRVGMKVNSS